MINWSRKSNIIQTLTGLFLIGLIQIPSKAFIPNIYEPKEKELKELSLAISRSALQLLYFRQTQEAINLAELAIQINPDDDKLWMLLGEAQIRNDEFNKAIISLEKAKKIAPKKSDPWFRLGFIAFQQKKLEDAIRFTKKGIELDPKNENGYFQLGNTQIKQGKFQIAFESFQKAANLKENFWEALNNQGLVLYELGQHKKAIRIWRKVLTIEEDAEPMLALAVALHKANPENPESISLAKASLEKNPLYISESHQKEQLWGKRLREATKRLLAKPALSFTVERALSKAVEKDR